MQDHIELLNNNNSLNVLNSLTQADNDNDTNPYNSLTIDSSFYDTETILTKLRASNKPIFLNINIQSLNSKFEKLKNFILNLTNNNLVIDIIALQETWLVRYPHLLLIPGFQPLIFINRKRGRGGGVGFYVRNGLSAHVIDNMTHNIDKIFETLTLDISYTNTQTQRHYIVSNIYRSPSAIQGLTNSQQHDEFLNKFDTLLTDLNNCNKDAYIFLDSNINLLNSDNNQHATNYMTTITNSGFILTNYRASRMQNGSSSLIDHILSNNKATSITSGTIICDISDHFITFLQPNIQKNKSKPSIIKKRNYSKDNLAKFKLDLYNTNWDVVTNCNEVNSSYDKFWEIYTLTHDTNFPLTTTKFNKNLHRISDFMTQGLLISRKNKLNLHKIALTDNVPFNWQQYKTYRNMYNKIVRASKAIHISTKINANAKNPKKTWDILREITTGKPEQNKIEKIVVNGETICEPNKMAEEFNNFFTMAGKKVAESVEPIHKLPTEYIPDANPTLLKFENISEHTIVDIISEMESKSSMDAMGVNMKTLKLIKYQIAKPLSHIFNLSATTGVFPAKLKISKTIPIYKAGDHSSCDNYRPISLLSSISKILEKIIAKALVNHLEDNNLLDENQFGFLRNRSTIHNILKLTNKVAHDLNDKKFVVGIFLDLKKAFDTVSHDILLKKLQKLGIKDTPLKWFTDYLTDRYQYTDISGSKSTKKLIDISVMQGSILGPILFLCFINDLHLATVLLTLLFADDTVCIDSDTDLPSLINRVNEEIQKIANWFRANRMAVNVSKTKYIIFRPRGVKINLDLENNGVVYNSNEIGLPEDPQKILKLGRIWNDNPDKKERTYKFLGLLLDEYLSFDAHCETLCTKLARSNFIISRVKNILPTSTLKTLYYSLIHPHLLYGLPIYSCTTQKNISKVFRMQKKAIRTITKSKYNAPTSQLFSQLKILPLEHLITLNKGILIHSIYYKTSPSALHGIWLTNEQRGINRDLRDAHQLYLPLARTDHVKRLPYFSYPKTWNDLPDLKLSSNPTTFKISLKSHLHSLIYVETD